MELSRELWAALDGPADLLDAVTYTGPEVVLPSGFRLTELATSTVAVANLALAEYMAGLGGTPRPVSVDRVAAMAAFRCEALQQPQGWTLPEVWDPLAGDYPTADGWIRLHTNYDHHRHGALAALGVDGDRDAVAAAVAAGTGEEIEAAVVAAGGCAAAMRTVPQWSASAAGQAVAAEPLVAWQRVDGAATGGLTGRADRPLAGVRVLDLTRVLAGPIATRFLAAYGADVLRVDPPGFVEVAAVVPETSVGKRMAVADLTEPGTLAALVRQADVVVLGTRPGASVAADTQWLRAQNPSLIISRHDAYGWTGPWRGRRGFDSLVQMSVGIAADQMERTGADRPVPLAAQALDHGTGYLIAAAVVRALTERRDRGVVAEVRTSLARTAACLVGAGPVDHFEASGLGDLGEVRERAETFWGPVDRVRVPGRIEGLAPAFGRTARPVGSDPLGWD